MGPKATQPDDGKFVFYPRTNPWVDDFPTDIDEIDLAEKEHTIRTFLTNTQDWMHEGGELGTEVFSNTALTPRRQEISDWREAQGFAANDFCELYVKIGWI